MRIRFVTTNAGKLAEAQAKMAPLGIDVRPYRAPIEEIQADTLEEVARHKAGRLVDVVPAPYFLEDAGLFVDALGGFPGVYSHHAFATVGCQGILDLLRRVTGPRRSATFRAVIGFVDGRRRLHLVAGACRGRIASRARGDQGFGFDPIFLPQGSSRTFGQMGPAAKGAVSHRGRALDALARFVARHADKKV